MSSVYVDDTTWMEPWMPPFRTYLSNRLIVYFNEHPTINPEIFIDQNIKFKMKDKLLNDIIFSKDENGNLYIPDETISNIIYNKQDESSPTKNGLNGAIKSLILKAEHHDKAEDYNNTPKFISYLATPELNDYLENWHKPSGGKKTRKYKKRKTRRGKTRRGKTRRSKTRRSRR